MVDNKVTEAAMNNLVYRVVPIAVLLVFLLNSLVACAGVEDRTYWSEARSALEEVRALLIKSEACLDEARDCSEIIFRSPASEGFELQIFGIRDQFLLEQIKNIARRSLQQTPEMKRVIVIAYAGDGTVPSFNQPPKRVGLIFKEEFTR